MNYISHLNEVFRKFYEDKKISALDISLYMALFQVWNIYRFPNEFHINREEIMNMAKIGSKTNYHKGLKTLSKNKYIRYNPSFNIYYGSRVRMTIMGTGSGTSYETGSETTPGRAMGQSLGHNINNSKPIENNNKRGAPENNLEVLIFFETKNWSEKEAQKFFNYYESLDWKKHGSDPIKNWKALAENWMIKADEMKKTGQKFYSKYRDTESYLNVQKSNDYGKPL